MINLVLLKQGDLADYRNTPIITNYKAHLVKLFWIKTSSYNK